MNEPETLLNLLQSAAESRGDATMYRFLSTGEADGPHETASARSLFVGAKKVGAALAALDLLRVTEPRRAMLAFWSPIEFARAFFGCLVAGISPIPVYPLSSRSSPASVAALKWTIADARPSLLIADQAALSAIRNAHHELDPKCPLFELAELAARTNSCDSDCRQPCAGDTALVQYTSGTTSSPRGVEISHEKILSSLRSICNAVAPPPDAVAVSWLPLSHDLGMIGNFLLTLYSHSAELVLMTPQAFIERPVRWLRAISEFRAWGTSAPSFAFGVCNKMIRKAQVENVDLSCLESVLCGGDPIDAGTLDRFAHRFAPQGFRRESLRPCYGLVEATLFVSLARPRRFTVNTFDRIALGEGRLENTADPGRSRRIVSCGVVQPELDLAVINPATGLRVGNGEIGELWISGASVATAYLDSPQKQDRDHLGTIPDCDRVYLRTGDLGALYNDELYVTGRCVDLVTNLGRRYDAHDLERLASTSYPDLRPEGIVVFHDVERLVVLAEVTPFMSEDACRMIVRRIRTNFREACGPVPDVIALVPPRSVTVTSSGKLRRADARVRFKKGCMEPTFLDVVDAPAVVDSAGSLEAPGGLDAAAVEKALLREIKIAARRGEQERLPPDRPLSALGLNPDCVLQFATAMRELLKRDVPSNIFSDDPTVAMLLARLR